MPALSDADVRRWGTLLAAADARRADTVAIDSALASPHSAVRAAATLAIGQIPVRARSVALRALLADPDTAVAANAAFSLGMLRDTASVPALAGVLGAAPTLIAAAAWSLGEIGEPARATIERTLTTGEPSAALAPLLVASAKLRPPPAGAIARHFESPRSAVRWAAAYAATRGRNPSIVRPLLALAERMRSSPATVASDERPPHEVRASIARGLGRPVTGDSLAAEALVVLRALAVDAHPQVRVNAARALASHGAAAREPVRALLRDPDANVRIAVAQNLPALLDSSGASWQAAWEADTGFTFRRSVLAGAMQLGVALVASGDGSSSWSRSGDWRHRAAAAEAAGASSSMDRAAAIAAPLLSDPDGRVRSAAVGALARWADSSQSAGRAWSRAALLGVLADSDVFVRAAVIGALTRGARATDVPAILAAWRASASDRNDEARMAALQFLAAAWRRDSASFDDALRREISALPAPAGGPERTAGRALSLLAGWPEAGGTTRSQAWYESQVRAWIVPALAGRPARAELVTERGRIVVELFGADAPLTVTNFASLAESRYYDGLRFHRVVPNFVAQDGDPRGDGGGGPGYAIRDELNRRYYERGAVGMALSGPDTGGSQYFLTHSPQPHLDGHYTVFGMVREGLDVMDALVQGDRLVSIRIR